MNRIARHGKILISIFGVIEVLGCVVIPHYKKRTVKNPKLMGFLHITAVCKFDQSFYQLT